jgi:hypothetical protein
VAGFIDERETPRYTKIHRKKVIILQAVTGLQRRLFRSKKEPTANWACAWLAHALGAL